MNEEETKNCPNCKREIPAVNFTIHSVHCARNIRVCPVCKEPVPSAELDDHHQKFHKLLPCKQCGESVCGTDLEDHIRDSCANTIKTCRYCELELPRRELPAHEAYCGVRTEQCAECREWVMLKYRQLHLDSNHGFLRLDDDPAPAMEPPKLTRPAARPSPHLPSSSSTTSSAPANSSSFRPVPNSGAARPSSAIVANNLDGPGSSSGTSGLSRPAANGVRKRTNDQPQINTNAEQANKVDKKMPASLGAVKKRPAPRPPRAAPPDARRDFAYYSAMARQQAEQRDRAEQNRYNLVHGLPPVLDPAAKLEKLRKMDALHNRELDDVYDNRRRETNHDQARHDFQNVKPMTPEQFMARFSELQLRGGAEGAAAGVGAGPDRFNQIKTSLRELRRGLNEVTAPYNNNYSANNNNEAAARAPSPSEVRLPCEFCTKLVPADDLVQHQTGCRPDLTQYRRSPSPRATAPAAPHDPVIPCEFCAQSLPVYLITEHQERCARDEDILSPD